MTRAGALAAAAALACAAGSWLAWQRDDPTPVAAAGGAQLFQAKGCAACHAGPSSRPSGDGFPDLSNAAAWAGERRPGMSAAEYLAQSMRDPSAFISPAFTASGGPTTAMPLLMLGEEEVDALVGYLLDAQVP